MVRKTHRRKTHKRRHSRKHSLKHSRKHSRRHSRGGRIIKLKCEYNSENANVMTNGMTRYSMANSVGPAPDKEATIEKAIAKKVTNDSIAKKSASQQFMEIPKNGMVYPWFYKGTKYYINSDGGVWTIGKNGNVNDWVGLYNKTTNTINESIGYEGEIDL